MLYGPLHQAVTSPRVVVIGAGFGGLGRRRELLRARARRRHRPRAGRRRRRRLARQHLPGRRLRRAVAALLLVVRAQPGLGPPLLPPGGDPRLPARAAAEAEGLLDLVRTGVEVTAAATTRRAGAWHLDDRDRRDRSTPTSSSPRSASSPTRSCPTSRARTFAGPAFHSAQWRHDVDLTGQAGRGGRAPAPARSSSCPGIVDRVGALTVFQRSAPYVVPKPDQEYTARHHRLFRRVPGHAGRRAAGGLLGHRAAQRRAGRRLPARPAADRRGPRGLAAARCARQVPDPELRRKLVPDYPIGCKRLLFSNDWYPALAREPRRRRHRAGHRLEPARRAHRRRHAARGRRAHLGHRLRGHRVPGADARSPASAAPTCTSAGADGARAHLGISVPGFPNLFCVYGPNTNLGGSSIINMMEAQAGYIGQVASRIADGGAARGRRAPGGRPRPTTPRCRAGSRRASGRAATRWYRDGGRITTNWPGLVAEYQRRTATVDWSELRARASAPR